MLRQWALATGAEGAEAAAARCRCSSQPGHALLLSKLLIVTDGEAWGWLEAQAIAGWTVRNGAKSDTLGTKSSPKRLANKPTLDRQSLISSDTLLIYSMASVFAGTTNFAAFQVHKILGLVARWPSRTTLGSLDDGTSLTSIVAGLSSAVRPSSAPPANHTTQPFLLRIEPGSPMARRAALAAICQQFPEHTAPGLLALHATFKLATKYAAGFGAKSHRDQNR